MAATPETGGDMTNIRELPIGRRVAELEAMLARGRKRGEKTPDMMDMLELVLAPIYLRALFLGPVKTTKGIDRLVDRALASRNCGVRRATDAAQRTPLFQLYAFSSTSLGR